MFDGEFGSSLYNTPTCSSPGVFSRPCCRQAGNPELLDALFTLSVEVLDRYVAAHPDDPQGRGVIDNYARTLGSRQIWGLKPYMRRLQERYLGKEAPGEAGGEG